MVTCTWRMWFCTSHVLPAYLQSVSWIKRQGTGKPALLGLLVLEALKIELPCPITCNYQLPENSDPESLVISFWLGKEGATLQWQDLAFPLCLMHFPSVSHVSLTSGPPISHLTFAFPWRFDWYWVNSPLIIRVARTNSVPFFFSLGAFF